MVYAEDSFSIHSIPHYIPMHRSRKYVIIAVLVVLFVTAAPHLAPTQTNMLSTEQLASVIDVLRRIFYSLASLVGEQQAQVISSVNDIQPGHWYEVPNSQLKAVEPCPSRTCPYSAIEGIAAVMNDWSGGAFDTLRDRLIVWGGGHSGYGGNEIYVFDLNTLQWERVTDPSLVIVEDVAIYPDGRPSSVHTYNALQYVASADKFCTAGSAAVYSFGASPSFPDSFCFDFNTKVWTHMGDALSWGIGATSAYDNVTGRMWVRGTGWQTDHGRMSDWNIQNNTWTLRNSQNVDIAYSYARTADIDPIRRKYVEIGIVQKGIGIATIDEWDISNPNNVVRRTVTTTGDTEILNGNAPGFVYDKQIDKFVAWNGGSNVYTLDMDSKVWTKWPALGGDIPTAPNPNGTFGRFRYSPNKNVFVVVNSVDENVYIYKLDSLFD